MDFFTVSFFLFLYYVRPHDWMPALEVVRPITTLMGLALLGMFTRRGGWSPRDALRTPQDWGMLAFALWILFTAPDPLSVWGDSKSALIFYVVTAAALSSWARLRKYLGVWTWMLVFISAIGVGSLYGLDFTHSLPVTESMQGRLALNTYMLNNPNAYGHAVVAALPLLYFLLIWKGEGSARVKGFCCLLLVAAALYFTKSKGAYMVGLLGLVAALMFGRPRAVQIAILLVASTLGVVGLTQLPRMHDLNRSEEGIQGRLIAWEMARAAMNDKAAGVGFNGFTAEFRWDKVWVKKSTHSSFVQVGASTGYFGLFLYAGLLVTGLRTLLLAKTRNDEEERVRRMLFALLFAFICSAWMVDRANNVDFFIMMAAISAFHRLVRRAPAPQQEEVMGPGWSVTPQLAIVHSEPSSAASSSSSAWEPGLRWNRLDWVDLLLTLVALAAIVQFWNLVLKR